MGNACNACRDADDDNTSEDSLLIRYPSVRTLLLGREGATFGTKYELTDESLGGDDGVSETRVATAKTKPCEAVAVKIVRKIGLSPERETDLRMEVGILRRLRHPNIIRLVDFFEEPMTFYVVTELAAGRGLFDTVVSKAFYSEKEARDCLHALLYAVKYLHDRGIIHRDIVPRNVLLSSEDDGAELKLAGFALAVECPAEGLSGHVVKSSLEACAPELVMKKPYGKPSDMWSVGVLAFTLLGGYAPFQHLKRVELERLIKTGAFEFHPDSWANVSVEAKSFIASLLTVHPDKRSTVGEAMRHAWMLESDAALREHSLANGREELRRLLVKERMRTESSAGLPSGLSSRDKNAFRTNSG